MAKRLVKSRKGKFQSKGNKLIFLWLSWRAGKEGMYGGGGGGGGVMKNTTVYRSWGPRVACQLLPLLLGSDLTLEGLVI